MIRPSIEQKTYQALKFFFVLVGLDKKIDSYFKVQKFSKIVNLIHFDQRGYCNSEKKDFFKNQILELEIETHGYCNRKCSFCSNTLINRFDKEQVMPESLFNRIIDELAEIDFRGTIKFNRYNEPLANEIIFDRIAYARKKLQKSVLGFHTNGDFVTIDKLKRLESAGLNFIAVSLYIDFDEPENRHIELSEQCCKNYLKKIKLKAKLLNEKSYLARYESYVNNLKIGIYILNMYNEGNDRGGSLGKYSHKVRNSPCESPFNRMFIDWTGDILPCCNLRGDIPMHKDYIIGNVKLNTLQDIFFSEKANNLRKHLADFNEKEGPCRYCEYGVYLYSKAAKKLIQTTLENIEGET